MKATFVKILFVLGLFLILTTGVALAMETQVFTGKVTSGRPMDNYFQTHRTGDIVVEVTYTKKPSGNNGVLLIVMQEPESIFICMKRESPPDDNPRYLVCVVENAPPGYYRGHFATMSGNAQVTMSITAETD